MAELALGSPVPFQQGLIWSLEAAVAQEAKIFATLLGLLRDSHLKGFVCAFVLSAGCSQSSHLSLEMVDAFYHVVSYILAFAQLGNSPNCFCVLSPEPLTSDWGVTKRIDK